MSRNRLVVIGLLGCCTVTPLFVAVLTMVSPSTAIQWFWLAYLPLGFNPIMLRIISNYALELAPTTGLQPHYVSLVEGYRYRLLFYLLPWDGELMCWVVFRFFLLVLSS